MSVSIGSRLRSALIGIGSIGGVRDIAVGLASIERAQRLKAIENFDVPMPPAVSLEDTTRRAPRAHRRGRKTSHFVTKRLAKGMHPSSVHAMANDKRFHLMFNPLLNSMLEGVITR